MSLLLEALRKAERQSLRERGSTASQAQAADAGSAPGFAELQKVSPTLAATTRDGTCAEAERVAVPTGLALELAPEPASPATGEPAAAPIPRDEAVPSPAQGAGHLLSDGANRRSWFFAALALLSLVAVAAVGYFWSRLQPATQAPGGNAAPPLPGKVSSVEQSVPARLDIPGLPAAGSAKTPAAVPLAAAVSRVAATRSPAGPTHAPAAESAAARSRSGARAPQDATRVHARVEAGYAAFRRGDLDAARTAYQHALTEEPDNADAILGMAVLETRAGRLDRAESLYRRLLQASPRDPYAQAGLLALRAERVDPLQAESLLKTLLAADPDAALLNFSLGNQLARQGRWAEARQAYLQALKGDSEDPDLAFNLAVSLDRLHQPAQAMAYYRRALELAERRGASFPPEAARLRLQQLQR